MNKNQVKTSASEAKGKSRAEKHGGKTGAVLGDMNGEAKKTTRSTKKAMK